VRDGETNSGSTGIFSTSSVSLVRSAARSYRPPGSDELIEPRSISGTRLNHVCRGVRLKISRSPSLSPQPRDGDLAGDSLPWTLPAALQSDDASLQWDQSIGFRAAAGAGRPWPRAIDLGYPLGSLGR
jgi:hypothetical protein